MGRVHEWHMGFDRLTFIVNPKIMWMKVRTEFIKHLKYTEDLKRSYEEPFVYMCVSQNGLLITQTGLERALQPLALAPCALGLQCYHTRLYYILKHIKNP